MKCQICKKRESELTFGEETFFALTHRFESKRICRLCFINLISDDMSKVVKNLKEQIKLLYK